MTKNKCAKCLMVKTIKQTLFIKDDCYCLDCYSKMSPQYIMYLRNKDEYNEKTRKRQQEKRKKLKQIEEDEKEQLKKEKDNQIKFLNDEKEKCLGELERIFKYIEVINNDLLKL